MRSHPNRSAETAGPAMDKALDLLRRANAPMTAMVQAVADKRIALALASDPTKPLPTEMFETTAPTILLVGDDPPVCAAEALGPSAWTGLRRLRYWRPRMAFVHGTGGQHAEYAGAVVFAEAVGRLVFVETSSAMAPAWRDWLGQFCPGGFTLLPNDGGVHPVAEARH